MKLRKKQKSGEEGYWKSFTDIMSGLLLIILLIMMLLLLYVTQINKEEHTEDYQFETTVVDDNYTDYHRSDEMYDRPPRDGGAGGGGGYGVDDPGENDNEGIYNERSSNSLLLWLAHSKREPAMSPMIAPNMIRVLLTLWPADDQRVRSTYEAYTVYPSFAP